MNVTNRDVKTFMIDIKDILSDKNLSCEVCQSCSDGQGCNQDNITHKQKKLSKSVNDRKGTTRTNVVYLNTNCNLRCEYCYEGDSRQGLSDQANCSELMLDTFVNEIYEREGDLNSCIVVMGGEPLLRFDLYEYLVRKVSSLSKAGGWAIPITTNALLFLDERLILQYKELKMFAESNNVNISIEVSYDGSGHFRRKFPNGTSSKEHVERAVDNLVKHNVFFSMSYTVQSGNYNNVVEDMIKICERWPMCDKVALSFAHQDLDSVGPVGYTEILRSQLRPYLNYVYSLYGIPFCGVTCEPCGRCDKSMGVGNAYLSPTTGISYADKATNKKFSQF